MADESFLHDCLFFTTNRLSRAITKMAEEEFAMTGLTPMYGYVIRLVIGNPGIPHKEVAEKLYISPSTLTRFVDKLQSRQLVERQVQGKHVFLYPTEKGLELEETIRAASRNLCRRYQAILGVEPTDLLAAQMELMSEKLENE